MAAHPKLLRICSFLMAALFGYSASVQLDDPDWYLWLPLYTFACLVNLTDPSKPGRSWVRKMGAMALLLGLFLFFKVVLEDYREGIAGLWSFNLRERVVREKFGSGLVIGSMFLHLIASSSRAPQPMQEAAGYGMAMLVAISYGLSFVFFSFQKDEVKEI